MSTVSWQDVSVGMLDHFLMTAERNFFVAIEVGEVNKYSSISTVGKLKFNPG